MFSGDTVHLGTLLYGFSIPGDDFKSLRIAQKGVHFDVEMVLLATLLRIFRVPGQDL